MSRPIYHAKLERMLLPTQYTLMRRIQTLYPGGDLLVTDDLLLEEPPAPEAAAAHEFSAALHSIWEMSIHPSDTGSRIPACDWISTLPAPPTGFEVDDMMSWGRLMVEQVNRRLSGVPRFVD